MNLPLKEKRRYYRCREGFKTLTDLIIYTALVKFSQKRIQQLADRSYREGNSFFKILTEIPFDKYQGLEQDIFLLSSFYPEDTTLRHRKEISYCYVIM